MTPAELVTYINDNITSNGNNEITADVLRPVLVAMVNQINDLVGDENDLPSGSDTVIEAINDISTTASGINIHEGTADPNDTPPGSFTQGDFYNQVNGSSVTIAFWQYNGLQWTEIISRYQQKLRNMEGITSNYTVDIDDDIIIYDGSNSADVVTMPNIITAMGKKYTIVNISGVNINLNTNYRSVDDTEITLISANTVLEVISDGIIWFQIQN